MNNLDTFLTNLFTDNKAFSVSYDKDVLYGGTVNVLVEGKLLVKFDSDGKFLGVSAV